MLTKNNHFNAFENYTYTIKSISPEHNELLWEIYASDVKKYNWAICTFYIIINYFWAIMYFCITLQLYLHFALIAPSHFCSDGVKKADIALESFAQFRYNLNCPEPHSWWGKPDREWPGRTPWWPASWDFGFSCDRQQNIQCVLIYRCCVLVHVWCSLFSVGNKVTTITTTIATTTSSSSSSSSIRSRLLTTT